ncbi:MAG TPA: hypothetical protein VLL97_07710 [Acidobacteriota bacterium]|nr:hypothetical protein [Acidobacteriota bacterium]
MTKDIVLKLKYLGSINQSGFIEYGFRIEDEGDSFRIVVLTIDNSHFSQNSLMLQEAPDLCYQKLLACLDGEKTGGIMPVRAPVTVDDISNYRDRHPSTKMRKHAQR